jgi:hypothetical protein
MHAGKNTTHRHNVADQKLGSASGSADTNLRDLPVVGRLADSIGWIYLQNLVAFLYKCVEFRV